MLTNKGDLALMFVCLSAAFGIDLYSNQPGWVLQNPSLTPRQLSTVYFADPRMGWIGGRRCIFHTRDSGKTWREQPIPDANWVLSFSFFDTSNGWAVGGNGAYVLFTSDGGEHWAERNIANAGSMNKILFQNRQTGWIVQNRSDSNLLKTEDGGTTWSAQHVCDYHLKELVFASDSVGFVAGERYLGKTVDGGRTWRQIDTNHVPADFALMERIVMVSGTTGYLACANGIAKTTDGGETWEKKVDAGITGGFYGLTFTSPDTGYVFFWDDPVYLWKTTDGGENWDYWKTAWTGPMQGVAALSRSAAVAVAENGAIYRIFGPADSASEVTSGTGTWLTCVDFCDSLHGCAGKFMPCEKMGLFTSNGGKTWLERKIGVDSTPFSQISQILYFDSNTIFVQGSSTAGQNLSVTSADGGDTWQMAGNFPAVNQMRKIPGNTRAAYATTYNGDLLMTLNTGKTWPAKSVPPSQYLFFALNSDSIWAMSSAGLKFTNNGGQTWDTICSSFPYANITDLSFKDIFFRTPEVGWIAGTAGLMQDRVTVIFRTDDGGKTWVRQSNIAILPDYSCPPPVFRNVIRICAHDTMEAWILDEGGLLHTMDGGTHWIEDSLPQKPASLANMYYASNAAFWVVGMNAAIWRYSEGTGSDGIVPRNQPANRRLIDNAIWARMLNSRIVVNLVKSQPVELKIFDLAGRTRLLQKMWGNAGRNYLCMKGAPLPRGVYYCSVAVPGGKTGFTLELLR